MHIDNDIAKQTPRDTSLATDALLLGAFGAGLLAGRWFRNRKKRCTGRCHPTPTPTLITPAAAPSASAPGSPTSTAASASEPSSGVPIATVDAPDTASAPRSTDAGNAAAHVAETAVAPSDIATPHVTTDDEIERPRNAGNRTTFSIGGVLKAGMEALAALQPLPAAPTVQGVATVDTENLVTYQAALAVAAKRDEQIRSIGSLLACIVK